MREFHTILEAASDGVTLNEARRFENITNDEKPIVRKTIHDMNVAYRPFEGPCEDVLPFLEAFRSCIMNIVCGDGICLYEETYGDREIRMTCCYPVRQEVLDGAVAVTVLKGGVTISTEHGQGFNTVGKSWERLFDFIEAGNIPVLGARREIYRGLHRVSHDDLVVELQVPVDMRHIARISSR